jgi:hypothetical protein
MPLDRLHGVQYVRLAPGAAETLGPYLRVPPDDVLELVIDLPLWPEDLASPPVRSRDGRLLAGDPILLAATDAGLMFAGRGAIPPIVPWHAIHSLDVLPVTDAPSRPHGEDRRAVSFNVTTRTCARLLPTTLNDLR